MVKGATEAAEEWSEVGDLRLLGLSIAAECRVTEVDAVGREVGTWMGAWRWTLMRVGHPCGRRLVEDKYDDDDDRIKIVEVQARLIYDNLACYFEKARLQSGVQERK